MKPGSREITRNSKLLGPIINEALNATLTRVGLLDPGSFRVHRLLQAAEAAQRADTLTFCSGHLGPRSLNRPHMDTKQPFWRMSQSQGETPKPLTVQRRQIKTLTDVRDKELRESPSEFTASTALVESEVLDSRQDQATGRSSHAGGREDGSVPKMVHCSSNSVPSKLRASSQKKADSSSDPEKSHFNHGELNNKDHLKTKQRFGREFIAKQELWAGRNVVEMHERKLQKELKKLSVQSWPSRDRLAVFSDVFDDVCESSPVFGRILREIKTDYDLYVNHMMDSQSAPCDKLLNISLEDLGRCKEMEVELDEAEKEVCRLEQEARRALQENKRVRNESHNVPALTGPEDSAMKSLRDSGTSFSHGDSVQVKRLQVLNMWREIQPLEEEIKEKLVSTVTTTATEKHIKHLKSDRVRLIAINDRLKATNENLENKINMVLNREKSSKTIRRTLWNELQSDLQTESE
ncbi:uncharacterized protein C6orf118-like [Hippoglossus hippoglossus]|uniref:uncharacterized protein C6orf118-like n=1 Tax=Hippoglossus hippoglossus TaxID=8267 RepID=UPI00148E50ED|nr:uncharacterized protein C6orf118-like [Hippoglossus hippoglossus]XP_047198349.1 uncharacterized protein C6orf118-like [Hippoglossus stenolepis]